MHHSSGTVVLDGYQPTYTVAVSLFQATMTNQQIGPYGQRSQMTAVFVAYCGGSTSSMDYYVAVENCSAFRAVQAFAVTTLVLDAIWCCVIVSYLKMADKAMSAVLTVNAVNGTTFLPCTACVDTIDQLLACWSQCSAVCCR